MRTSISALAKVFSLLKSEAASQMLSRPCCQFSTNRNAGNSSKRVPLTKRNDVNAKISSAFPIHKNAKALLGWVKQNSFNLIGFGRDFRGVQ